MICPAPRLPEERGTTICMAGGYGRPGNVFQQITGERQIALQKRLRNRLPDTVNS